MPSFATPFLRSFALLCLLPTLVPSAHASGGVSVPSLARCGRQLLPGPWHSAEATALRLEQLRRLAATPSLFGRLVRSSSWNVHQLAGAELKNYAIDEAVRRQLGDQPRIRADVEGRVVYEREDGSVRIVENLFTRTFTVERWSRGRREAFLGTNGRPAANQRPAFNHYDSGAVPGALSGDVAVDVHALRALINLEAAALRLPPPGSPLFSAPERSSLASAVRRFLGTEPGEVSARPFGSVLLLRNLRTGYAIEDHPRERYFRVLRIVGEWGIPVDGEGSVAPGQSRVSFHYDDAGEDRLKRPMAKLLGRPLAPELAAAAPLGEREAALAQAYLSTLALDTQRPESRLPAIRSLVWAQLSPADRGWFLHDVRGFRAEGGPEWSALIKLAKKSRDPAWLPVLAEWHAALALERDPWHGQLKVQVEATEAELRRRSLKEEFSRAAE